MRILLILFLAVTALAQPRRLLVVSVDGLDQRYLTNAGKLGLKIPNLRRLTREGRWSDGVVGVVPTVTWPSHTTMISGVDPAVHGIRGNRRPRSEGGDYYWSASLLKAPTLLDAMKTAGRTTAAITWPVTVDAPVTYNLPEYFVKRRGGDMDTKSIGEKATPPDLVEKISAQYPAFPQQWMEDRTRTLAALYLLKTVQPDLILLHLVNLDSEAHDTGPFSPESNATLEHIDDLIGEMIRALPAGYRLVLLSDHGFERVERTVRLDVSGVQALGFLAIAETPEAAARLDALQKARTHGLGRRIPEAELRRFAPDLLKAAAVYESAEHFRFGAGNESVPRGEHGHWPMRYRAVYLEWGPSIEPGRLPEMSMTAIAGRLAELLGISFRPNNR